MGVSKGCSSQNELCIGESLLKGLRVYHFIISILYSLRKKQVLTNKMVIVRVKVSTTIWNFNQDSARWLYCEIFPIAVDTKLHS